MKDLRELDPLRMRGQKVREIYGWEGDERFGAFMLLSPVDHGQLVIIASNDEGWDHISVSRKNRCPNWQEMDAVFRAFFAEGETAMQLHVPHSEHVNDHPYCLHIWRPHNAAIPKPPAIFVGTGVGFNVRSGRPMPNEETTP